MRNLVVGILLTIGSCSFGQSLDFGIDFKANQNTLLNANGDDQITRPTYTQDIFGDLYLQLPSFNFSFVDDYADTVFVRFTDVEISNNFEFPIYVRFSTKSSWYFDAKFSTAKYTLRHHGNIFQNRDYYNGVYGTIDDYIANYGGVYDWAWVNNEEGVFYDDTTAFISWFDDRIAEDFWSQAEVNYEEEFKFRSIYIGAGYRFLKHKTIRPYVYAGLGYRSTVSNFKRKHFEIDENFLNTVQTKQDLTGVSADIPSFSSAALGFRADAGVELYRYHFGVSADFTFDLTSRFDIKENIFNYDKVGAGFGTIAFYVGADLFNYYFNTKSVKDEVYEDEYHTLSSRLDRNRRWAIALSVDAPISSQAKNYGRFSIIDYKDYLEPFAGIRHRKWHSIGFREITKVNWSPRFEVGYRYNIIKRIDVEAQMGLARLELDTKVEDFRAIMLFDTLSWSHYYDPDYTGVNLSTFRSTFYSYSHNLNVYFTPVSNGLMDLRVFAGIGMNFIIVPYSTSTNDFGVNGSGNDVFESFLDYYWFASGYASSAATWYSDYQEDIDLAKTPDQLIAEHDAAGTITLNNWDRRRKSVYFTTSFGAEMELNRFLLGASTDITLGSVDGVLLKSYYNINVSLGYMLFTKNKLNRKIHREE